MKFHIVRNDESIEDILFLYSISKDEIVEENKHIRMWDKLIPGTKLKIPAISEAVEQDVSDMEPFVEDYYPKLTDKDLDFEEEVSLDSEKNLSKEQYIDNEQVIDSEKEIKEQFVDSDKVIKEQSSKPIKQKEEVIPHIKDQMKTQDTVKKENKVEIIPYKSVNPPQPQPNYNPAPNPRYPYYYGYYNYPRYVPYPIIYYPIYYQKRPT